MAESKLIYKEGELRETNKHVCVYEWAIFLSLGNVYYKKFTYLKSKK